MMNSSWKKITTGLVPFLLLALPLPAGAAPPKTPVQVEADQMIANQKDNSVFFSGKVEAKQEDLTIHSDEMTVYYTSDAEEAKSGDSRDIKRLLAKGHVEITKQDWVGTGDQAEYFSQERKVVLTGNTKVWQNNNVVTGETFVLYLDDGRSVVEKGQKAGERVKAFFYPNSKPQPKP